jgi:hypothetical protein
VVESVKMPSAVDIITYVGIPLAVLGVLPTIYTCLKSFLTLREISQTLYRNGVTAITRSALLSGIIEVEVPRRSICPLERLDPLYFSMRKDGEGKSSLKGGTWTLFYWKEMVIGVKSYRLQYHDELAQPQAEIDFEALIAFLLDRGAVPSPLGWADLRSSGLWTVAGTRLLLSPVSGEEVLSVAMSDDSDGILSLSLNWRPEWDRRGKESLPPYWIRVIVPEKGEDIFEKMAELENPEGEVVGAKEGKVDRSGGFLDDESAEEDVLGFTSPIRVKISKDGVQESYREDDTKKKLPLFHLRTMPGSTDSTTGFWFCCAATAFHAPQGGLWSFPIPPDVLTLARTESVPCGVMVLLGTMTDEEVPTWHTTFDDEAEQFEKRVKLMEQSRRIHEELRLPLAERAAASRKRMADNATEWHNDRMREQMKYEQKREAEIVEAMQSQRLPIAIVAEANRKWLLAKFALPDTLSTMAIVEQILFAMCQNREFGKRISVMLDLWRSWSLSGGMTKGHFLAVKEDQIVFSMASLVLAVIKSTVSEPTGSVVGDLQECLRVWRKVRLG